MSGAEFSHLDDRGAARMVDVSEKDVTLRTARAAARVRMLRSTFEAIERGATAKGAVLDVARIAAIQAAKRTGELIPLCHPLPLEGVEVRFAWDAPAGPGEGTVLLGIETEVKLHARTGAEMEALVAAAIAALTVYDMLKAVDRSMVVESIGLLEKTGGRTGTWSRTEPDRS